MLVVLPPRRQWQQRESGNREGGLRHRDSYHTDLEPSIPIRLYWFGQWQSLELRHVGVRVRDRDRVRVRDRIRVRGRVGVRDSHSSLDLVRIVCVW